MFKGKGRPPRGRPRATPASDRGRDAHGRGRDQPGGQRSAVEGTRSRPGKPLEAAEKEAPKSGNLQSPIRKGDKKLKEDVAKDKEPSTMVSTYLFVYSLKTYIVQFQ